MRVRLTVQRNNLPASNILWTVPTTTSLQAYTVSRLLEDVNHVIPLEAEQWGLEDYIVEVGGFECLHFSPVHETLKEDDHVCIRPLLTAEVRSRTLCGRTQISEDGRHLIDGISFGRPRLRQPHRPAVNIPPRKRRRVDEDTVGGNDSVEPTGLITAAGDTTSPPLDMESKTNKKRVQFTHTEEDWEDSEGDEDFMPGHVSEGSIDSDSDGNSETPSETSEQPGGASPRPGSPPRSLTGSSSTSETDTSSDASSDSESESGSEREASVDAESDSASDTTDSDSESDSQSDSDSDSPPEIITSKLTMPPFLGSKKTRRRNWRRKALPKLKNLKAEGRLHPDAGLADLRLYLGEGNTTDSASVTMKPGQPMSKSTGKRKRVEPDLEEPEAELSEEHSIELERRREELISRLAEDTVDTQRSEPDPGLVTKTSETPRESDSLATTPDPTKQDVDKPAPTPPTKRLRPNVSAIGRILKRQAVNIERKPKKAPVVEEPPEPEGASDPDFWKSRINLSAFECWDEDHELSAPPYPFEQHWDPASKLMRENQNTKKKKKQRKDNSIQEQVGWPVDNVDEEPEDTPVLDYDDSPATMKAASDPTDAIESQIMQDVQLAAKADLPLPPDDVSALPALQSNDIQVGAVVVFKLWTIDPATVTPNISEYKTAIVEKEGDSGKGAGTFRLRLADRDVPKKTEDQVDEKGRPIKNAVSGFRMGDDEDEDDQSLWEGMFAELVEPKLLQAADQT